MPSCDIWHGSDLLSCRFSSWDHSAHPARQFCRRWCCMLRTHNTQISWPPGKFRAQQSTALSRWLCTELSGSVTCESHQTGSMNTSGNPHWYLCSALPCTMWKYQCVQICFRDSYNPPHGIKKGHVSHLKMSLSCIATPSKLSLWRHTAVSEGSCVLPLHMTVLIQVLLKPLEGLPWKILALVNKTYL